MDFRKEKILQNRIQTNWIRTKERNGLEVRYLSLVKSKIDRKCVSSVQKLDKTISKLQGELQHVLVTSEPARERYAKSKAFRLRTPTATPTYLPDNYDNHPHNHDKNIPPASASYTSASGPQHPHTSTLPNTQADDKVEDDTISMAAGTSARSLVTGTNVHVDITGKPAITGVDMGITGTPSATGTNTNPEKLVDNILKHQLEDSADSGVYLTRTPSVKLDNCTTPTRRYSAPTEGSSTHPTQGHGTSGSIPEVPTFSQPPPAASSRTTTPFLLTPSPHTQRGSAGRSSPCRYGVFGSDCRSFPCLPWDYTRPKTSYIRRDLNITPSIRRSATSMSHLASSNIDFTSVNERRERLITLLGDETVRRPQKWSVDQTSVRERALYASISDLRAKLSKTKPPDYVVNYGEVNTRRTKHLRPKAPKP